MGADYSKSVGSMSRSHMMSDHVRLLSSSYKDDWPEIFMANKQLYPGKVLLVSSGPGTLNFSG